LKAQIALRPARVEDFTNGRTLLNNIVYFEFCSVKNKMQGPYTCNHSKKYFKDLIVEFLQKIHVFKSLYVPSVSNEATAKALSKFRCATRADLVDGKSHLKYGLTYYLKEEKFITGPFVLDQSTPLIELKTNLENQSIYLLTS
jgi:hypothetical protein